MMPDAKASFAINVDPRLLQEQIDTDVLRTVAHVNDDRPARERPLAAPRPTPSAAYIVSSISFPVSF